MADRQRMTVTFDVTESQAIALQEFFGMWNTLACMGSSRHVSFMVDGDGDFKPNCQFIMPMHSFTIPEGAKRSARLIDSVTVESGLAFDFDGTAARISAWRDSLRRPTARGGEVDTMGPEIMLFKDPMVE